VYLFEDKIEPVRLFKVLDHLQNVFVAAAVVEHFDLLEHSGTGMTWDLRAKDVPHTYAISDLYPSFLPSITISYAGT